MTRDGHGAPGRAAVIAFQLAIALPTVAVLTAGVAAGRLPGPGALVWVLMIAVVDLLPVPAGSGVQLTVSFPLMLATMLLYPPPVAGLVAFLGSFDARELRGRVSLLRAVFNRAQMALAILAAGACFHRVAGAGSPPLLLVPTVVAAATIAYALNTAVVAGAIGLSSRTPLWRVLRHMHGTAPYEFLVSYLGLGLLGAVFARFALREGVWSVALLVAAVVVARQMYFRSRALADRLAGQNRLLAEQAGQLEHLLAEVRGSEERFRALVQNASDVVTVADADGRIRYQTASVERVLGYAEGELLGVHLGELVHQGDLGGLLAAARGAGASPAPAPVEARMRHRGGAWRQTETVVTDLRDHPGVRGLVLNTRDVTERKRLEVQLRHAQKLESLGRLAGGVAHEMNTPIQFIGDNLAFLAGSFGDMVGLLEAYRETAGAAVDPPARERLSAAEAAADVDFLLDEVPPAIDQTLDGARRVAEIVRAMKAFSHPGQHDQAPADLNQALRDAVVVARSELRSATVELDLAELPPVACHLSDLNQVFLNLLVNAAHAIADAPAGGAGRVTVSTRHEGDQVVVAIADTGCGIPQDAREQVFDPFFTTKEVGRGTGQGLALAHTVVVDRHGGTIGFESEPGRGTTFTVRLPVAGSATPAAG